MTGKSSIEVASRIDRVDPEEWDGLCAGRPFSGHRWLRLGEEVMLDYEPRYLLLRREGRLEAGAVCAVQRHFHLSAYLTNRHLRAAVGGLLARFPLLRCGVPISFQPGLLVRPGVPFSLVSALLQGIWDLAAEERAPWIGLYDLGVDDGAWPALHAAGYHVVKLLPDACLELSQPSFEEHLARLSTKNRHELRRQRRRALEAGVKIDLFQLSPDNEARVRQLVSNVLYRHDQPDFYQPDLFSRALALLGDDMTLMAGWQGEHLVACGALLHDGDDLLLKWLGLDYSRTWNAHTYHLIMTELVAHAFQLGVRRVRCGPTAYEVKERMGAALEEHCLALAMRGRLFHELLGLFLTLAGKRIVPGALPVAPQKTEVL